MTKTPKDLETVEHKGPLGRAGLVTRKHPTLTWSDEGGSHSFSVRAKHRLGAIESVDVCVQDRRVSRLHADLELKNDGLWIRDLGSKNGTFINDVLVEHARVPDGATVRVGGTNIAVRYAKAPSLVELWQDDHFENLVGRSGAMRELFYLLSKVAPLADPVLIEGETGTGKELVARAIHAASPRKTHPFIVVDCGAMPDDLLESELFGHVKGAFTGASADRVGSVDAAAGGTLFLDEIGELPLSMQPKLLRLLESKSFRPVGSTEAHEANVRFVAATHRNLGEMVNQGTFREDLFFRLTVFSVTVPPLRSRAEDIPLLVEHFLPAEKRAAHLEELAALAAGRSWNGNVRELKNFVQRALALGAPAALAAGATAPARAATQHEPSADPDTDLPFSEARDRVIAQFEQDFIRAQLSKHANNVTAAAIAAGIDRTYLHRLMRKHGM